MHGMKSEDNSLEIRVLFIEEEDGWWSAQCLEYDIATQAKKFTQLNYEIEKVLMAYLVLSESEGRKPFEGIGPAPKEYWDLYESSQHYLHTDDGRFVPKQASHHQIPKPQVRVAEAVAA